MLFTAPTAVEPPVLLQSAPLLAAGIIGQIQGGFVHLEGALSSPAPFPPVGQSGLNWSSINDAYGLSNSSRVTGSADGGSDEAGPSGTGRGGLLGLCLQFLADRVNQSSDDSADEDDDTFSARISTGFGTPSGESLSRNKQPKLTGTDEEKTIK